MPTARSQTHPNLESITDLPKIGPAPYLPDQSVLVVDDDIPPTPDVPSDQPADRE